MKHLRIAVAAAAVLNGYVVQSASIDPDDEDLENRFNYLEVQLEDPDHGMQYIGRL